MPSKTLSSLLILIVTLSTSLSLGYIIPGDGHGDGNCNERECRGNHGDHDHGDHGGVQPGPVRPYPGNGGDPYRPGPGYPERPTPPPYPNQPPSQSTSRTMPVGRWLTNEYVQLSQLVGNAGRDVVIDSVVVNLGGSALNSRIDLRLNNMVEDSQYNLQGPSAILYPRTYTAGNIYSLDLLIAGQVYVVSVTVNMHVGYNQPNPGYGDVTLPINIGRRLYGNTQFDLTPYIDMRNYRGYRIVSVDINASAAYNAAILDLLINSFSAGQISLDSYPRVYSIIPRNQAIIGAGADNLMVSVRGDTNLNSVILRLSRR